MNELDSILWNKTRSTRMSRLFFVRHGIKWRRTRMEINSSRSEARGVGGGGPREVEEEEEAKRYARHRNPWFRSVFRRICVKEFMGIRRSERLVRSYTSRVSRPPSSKNCMEGETVENIPGISCIRAKKKVLLPGSKIVGTLPRETS